MNFSDYLNKFPTGKKFVLLTIDPDTESAYRISSGRFSTLPTDADLPNTVFSSIVADGGVPRMHRQVRDMFGGGSVASWGPVKLTTRLYKKGSVSQVDLATADIYGKKIEIRLSGPNDVTSYSETLVTLVGYLRSRQGQVGEGITLQVVDRKSLIEISVPTEKFLAASMGVNFPSSNEGKARQIVLGKWNNVPCTLIDQSDDIYEVSDPRFPVKDIVRVYNNGVDIGAGFTKDLANNRFTLAIPANSNERITAEVDGVKNSSGDMLSTIEEFVHFLLENFTDFTTEEILVDEDVPTDAAQLLIRDDASVSDYLDQLAAGVVGCWFVSALDKVKFRLIKVPSSGGKKFTARHHLQDVTWEEVEDIYYRIPYTYDRNGAVLTELGNVGDPDLEIWFKKEWQESEVIDTGVKAAFIAAKVADPINTPFLDKSAAATVATRALSLFGTQRVVGSVLVPYVSPAIGLLDSANLSDADLLNGDCLITEITEDLVSATPTLELRLWK